MSTTAGSTSPNSQRHENACRISPEAVGPRAGAIEIVMVTLPITRPRSCSGTTFISVVIRSGIITAAPMAWIARPANSTPKTGARAATSVPTPKTLIAPVKAVRVGTRASSQPVTGITTAMVSMKTVESHCAERADTENSIISRGIALTMIVSLMSTTKVPSSSPHKTA